ncbi:MAG: transposase, partial [Candidatus Thorarchaeota archaeon]|nr:transposase [Candidatus Thorarchaeota archaeon]
MDLKIIDISVNIDHVHLFIQYPPKYSVSFIAKKINEQNSETVLLTSQRIVQLLSVGTCYYGCVGWVVVENIFQLKTVQ